ncbi:MAG: hypothetical protein ABSG54_02240 [Terriglobia bacterium]
MGGDMEGLSVRSKRSRRGHWGWALLLLLVGVIGFLSHRPVMQLKAELPPGFAEVRKEWKAERRAAEERTARAYWQLALNVVQSQQAYGTKLPENPVPEFKLDEREFPEGSSEASPATRAKYWKRLREAWPLPQAWQQHHEWTLAWFPEMMTRFAMAASQFFSSIWARLNR